MPHLDVLGHQKCSERADVGGICVTFLRWQNSNLVVIYGHLRVSMDMASRNLRGSSPPDFLVKLLAMVQSEDPKLIAWNGGTRAPTIERQEA